LPELKLASSKGESKKFIVATFHRDRGIERRDNLSISEVIREFQKLLKAMSKGNPTIAAIYVSYMEEY
jgi:hypothetical protein